MLTHAQIVCPYCGETIDIGVDASAGDQRYIEDCQVCCRPICIAVSVDDKGDIRVGARSENET